MAKGLHLVTSRLLDYLSGVLAGMTTIGVLAITWQINNNQWRSGGIGGRPDGRGPHGPGPRAEWTLITTDHQQDWKWGCRPGRKEMEDAGNPWKSDQSAW